MRIWSIHPEYLDTKGLIALWRETLLAKHVLEGKTIGYKNHPQLERFKQSENSIDMIHLYLKYVYAEAAARKFKFDRDKFLVPEKKYRLNISDKQLFYEFNHLLSKLKLRSIFLYERLRELKEIKPHPLFVVVNGEIEHWENQSKSTINS